MTFVIPNNNCAPIIFSHHIVHISALSKHRVTGSLYTDYLILNLCSPNIDARYLPCNKYFSYINILSNLHSILRYIQPLCIFL